MNLDNDGIIPAFFTRAGRPPSSGSSLARGLCQLELDNDGALADAVQGCTRRAADLSDVVRGAGRVQTCINGEITLSSSTKGSRTRSCSSASSTSRTSPRECTLSELRSPTPRGALPARVPWPRSCSYPRPRLQTSPPHPPQLRTHARSLAFLRHKTTSTHAAPATANLAHIRTPGARPHLRSSLSTPNPQNSIYPPNPHPHSHPQQEEGEQDP
ncbi:hypothetical protein B0H11DRAFT_2136502 [Mycena galericulata]|nr:hypothetical protein B0H11DRAFT_2136502 [Mycena galericulata]